MSDNKNCQSQMENTKVRQSFTGQSQHERVLI